MRASEVTIPHLLRQAGYATCMSGKWHCNSMFNSPAQPQPSESGFEYWFATQNNAAPSHENPQNYVRNGAEVGDLKGYSCQLATGEALDWMQGHVATNPNQPFFIYLAFHEPHEPVASPEELVATYREQSKNEDEAQFFANVANVDLAVGRVLDALDALQLREKTLVVFTSDNGPETLNRYRTANRSYGSPGRLRGMKLWTTDAGFRVAGILSWPGRIQAGQVSNEVVSALDLLPSFCALAGVEPPSDLALDGTDMTPLFDGQRLERARPLVWCYYNAINEQRVAMRHGPWKMLARLDGGALAKSSNIYAGNADKYLSAELTDFELFDMSEDQSESRNLYPEANESQALRAMLQREYESLINDSHIWD
ncbi:MAG: sulfatase-like hydrolase/transferase [bacterium]|nr:sulfatase-like hydrolase/transferase [bacterium]